MVKTKPSLERILREYFACPKPVLKRPVLDGDYLRFLTVRGSKAYSSLVSLIYDLNTLSGDCSIAELLEKISNQKLELCGMESEAITHVLNAVFELVFSGDTAIAEMTFNPDDIIETLDDIVAGRTDGLIFCLDNISEIW